MLEGEKGQRRRKAGRVNGEEKGQRESGKGKGLPYVSGADSGLSGKKSCFALVSVVEHGPSLRDVTRSFNV